MNELVFSGNSSVEYYQHILLKRDSFLKMAGEYEFDYNLRFGDIILKIFELKVECIRKKKTIAFYQQAINFGGVVNNNELQAFLKKKWLSMRNI